jgi:hypothetical protein
MLSKQKMYDFKTNTNGASIYHIAFHTKKPLFHIRSDKKSDRKLMIKSQQFKSEHICRDNDVIGNLCTWVQ